VVFAAQHRLHRGPEQANAATVPFYAMLGFRTGYAYRHRIRSGRA
jgi:hypothetical protein